MTARFAQVLTIALCLALGPAAHADDRPNVLFIAVDDLNDWIGSLNGHPQAETPHIDRLAARGVLFTNAHCVAPACNPSRAAVFSGKLPTVTGVWSNQSKGLLAQHPETRHLPGAFARAGYRTMGTGKLLHAGTPARLFEESFATSQRWSPIGDKAAVEYSEEELPTKGTDNPRHVTRDRQGHTVVLPLNRMPSDRRPGVPSGESFDWGPFDVPDADMGDTKITDWAIDRLARKADKPIFLGVGYYRPHIPLWAPREYFDRFADAPAELPPFHAEDLEDLGPVARRWALEPVTAGSHATVIRFGQWRAAVEAYLACTTYVDGQIGRLLDALDGSPYADNTAIVLWSDHGWHLGEKQHWGKWTGWERSTRVPMIVVPPRKAAGRFPTAGSRCDQPVSLIDLYPTLTDLSGVSPPEDLDGTSLLPLLVNPRKATGRGVVTLFDPGNASIRTHRWRYIRYRDGSEELYDMRSDPNEWHNLASRPEHADQKRALARRLDDRLSR